MTARSYYHSLSVPVALIGIVHVLGGVAVLAAPQAAKVASFVGMGLVGQEPLTVAMTLIAVGLLAIASQLPLDVSKYHTILCAPQQILLLVQFLGIGVAIIAGAYPDGYQPVQGDHFASAWYILADQAAWVVLCLSHTLEWAVFTAYQVPTRAQHEYLTTKTEILEERLASCNRCWEIQHETKFWHELGNGIGPSAGPGARE